MLLKQKINFTLSIISLFIIINYTNINPFEEIKLHNKLNKISEEIDSTHQVKYEKLDRFFTIKNRNKLFNGVVLFAEYGEIIYKNAFGFANYKKRDSLQIDNSFQLASVSKPLTATGILILHDKKLLSIKDNVKKYLPEFPYKNISIQLLLTHRSGLPNYMYFADKFWPSRRKTIFNNDVLDLMSSFKPDIYYIPDYRYNYSNTNYALLASIIEKVSGMSYEKFLKTYIFEPLEMKHSSVYHRNNFSTLIKPTIGHNKRWRKSENSYLNGVVGDKGIYSTVDDLYKFDQALYHGLLSDTSLALAYKPAHKDLRIWDNYGMGWRIDASNKKNRVLYHSGWWKGFRTYFIRKIDVHKTIIVLTNTERINYIGIHKLRKLF